MPVKSELILNPNKTLTYRLCRAIVRVFAALLFRPRIIGAHEIPQEGPVIVAPVHRSNLDFAFSPFLSSRKVFFMAKDGLWNFKPLGILLERLGAFPVNRSATDREAMSLAEECLRQGFALVIFPEGTRKEGLNVETLHDGAMFIASRTGAKIVPVGIGGVDAALPKGKRIPRPKRVTIIVGPALDPPVSKDGERISRSQISLKTEELRSALERTYREAENF